METDVMGGAASVLVTGASGALGGRVVDVLKARGAPVVAGSRTPEGAAADARRIDFDDRLSLDPGFAGIERALLVSTDALAEPGLRQRQHRAAIEAARGAGVAYLAYTSMPNLAGSPAIFFAPDHVATEEMLAASGIAYGLLRNGWYQENLLAYLPQIIASGTWFTIARDGRIPHVARDDAAVAAAALLVSGEPGIFDIAGPRALTNREIAAAIGDVLGRRPRVVDVGADRLARELQRQGVPAPTIPMVIATEANQRGGRFEVADNAVERLTGRAPAPIEAFFCANADALLAHTH